MSADPFITAAAVKLSEIEVVVVNGQRYDLARADGVSCRNGWLRLDYGAHHEAIWSRYIRISNIEAIETETK